MSQIRGDKRIDLGKFVIARIKKKGQQFEILVDPDKAWEVKKQIRIIKKEKEKETNETYKVTVDDVLEQSKFPMEDIIEGFIIFEDLKRGEKVSDEKIMECFGTDDIRRITAEILLDGDLQLTKNQRDKFMEEKRKKLVDIIVKNCINPQTKKPHPPQRIERAFEEAKVSIDLFNPVEDQVIDIVRALKEVIPIKMERVVMALRIPAEFTGKGYGIISNYATMTKEEWKPDGTFLCQIELPAGIQAEFLDKINKLTHGRAQVKVIESKAV